MLETRWGTLSALLLGSCLLSCGGPQPAAAPRPGADLARGELLIEQEDWAGAAELFGGLVASSPGNAKAHYYLALSRENLGDPAAAEPHYRRAIELDAELLEARNNLGLILLDRGDATGAEAELALFLEAQPDEAAAHYNYGLALDALGRRDAAREHFERALTLDSGDAAPLMGLADMARAGGDLERAVELYRRAAGVVPDDPMPAIGLGQALLDLRRIDEAVGVLAEVGEASGADAPQITTAGLLLARYDEDEAAIGLYRKALARDGDYPTAILLLANALARKGAFEEAAGLFGRFLELEPEAPEAAAARAGLEACRAKRKR
jgi:tetratricopeptide (TPR) repeat protein